MGDASSTNRLTVSSGGTVNVTTGDAVIGFAAGSNGNSVTVTGAGSTLASSPTGTLYVGDGGSSNTLSILNGGAVTGKNARIGALSGSSATRSRSMAPVRRGPIPARSASAPPATTIP